jgi:hypothetical protein
MLGEKRNLDQATEGDCNSGAEKAKSDQRRRICNDDSRKKVAKTQRKFACPYDKRNPPRRYSSRKCSGSGYDLIARLKYEFCYRLLNSINLSGVRFHLFRAHSMPLHCWRCYVTFDNENLWHEHCSADTCVVRDRRRPSKGFEVQEKYVSGRRRREVEDHVPDPFPGNRTERNAFAVSVTSSHE